MDDHTPPTPAPAPANPPSDTPASTDEKIAASRAATTPLTAARAYLNAGWQPIPIRPGGKVPEVDGWPRLRLTQDELARHFGAETNVGILLGAASGGLVDVDIDHDSAKKLVRLLPHTGRVHGRPSNPDSHFWYLVNGQIEKTIPYKDPETGRVLIELRSTGGQTVVPPSRYRLDDGRLEQLYWAREGAPAHVDAVELMNVVRRIAAAALIGMHWPQEGSRNETALALAGCLLRSGIRQAEAETLVGHVCDVANDEEQEARVRCVASTREKLDRNEPVTGFTRLCDLIGEKVVTTAMEWLKLDPDREPGWDPPIPFDRRLLPDLPTTLLPGAFGEFAAALALSAQIPPSMAVMAVVGAVSSCISKRFVVSPKDGWDEPINVYTIIALPPGNNKSMVKRECVAPIDDWELMKRFEMDSVIQEAKSRRKNEEAQIESLRRQAVKERDLVEQRRQFAEVIQLEQGLTRIPVPPKTYVSDATPESLARNVSEQAGRLAVISDEGGVMEVLAGLYSRGRANTDILLKGIDGGRVRIERKDGTIDVEPYLTMLLIVQPRILQNMADQRSFQGNGLLERFLYLTPQSRLGYRNLDAPPIPEAVKKSYAQAVTTLLQIPPQLDDARFEFERPRRIRLSPEAAATWQAFRTEVEPQLRAGGRFEAAGAAGWAGKAPGVCLRIAGLLQVMETGEASKEVSAQNMMNAVAIMRALSEHALAAYGWMQSDQASQDAEHVLNWVQENRFTRFRRTECQRKFHGRFTTKKRFDAALAALVDRNIISPEREETTTQGKRATKYYDVNPALGGDRTG